MSRKPPGAILFSSTRRRILASVLAGARSCGDVAVLVGVARNTAWYHLVVRSEPGKKATFHPGCEAHPPPAPRLL